jgi:hypothetical protein
MEKQSWAESEKRKEERRSEKEKSQKIRRKKMQVRELCVSNGLWLRRVKK